MQGRLRITRLNDISFHHVLTGHTLTCGKMGDVNVGIEHVAWHHFFTRCWVSFMKYQLMRPHPHVQPLRAGETFSPTQFPSMISIKPYYKPPRAGSRYANSVSQ